MQIRKAMSQYHCNKKFATISNQWLLNEKIYIAQQLLVLHTLPQGMQLEYSKLQLRTSVCFETDQGHGLLHQNEHY